MQELADALLRPVAAPRNVTPASVRPGLALDDAALKVAPDAPPVELTDSTTDLGRETLTQARELLEDAVRCPDSEEGGVIAAAALKLAFGNREIAPADFRELHTRVLERLDEPKRAALKRALSSETPASESETGPREGSADAAEDAASAPLPPAGCIALESGKLPEIVSALEVVLGHSGRVFQRGGALVIPTRHDPGQRERVKRAPQALCAKLASVPALVDLAMSHSGFARFNEKDGEWKPADLPDRPALMLLNRPSWPNTPKLEGLAEAPILRKSGTVAAGTGYDEESGYLLSFDEVFPAIPDRPTRAEAEAALERLEGLVADFPFTTGAGRSVALAAMLTPFARPAMRTCPGYAFDAPTMGTGKTLLADLPALLATGREAAANQVPDGEEEMRKALLALAIEGDALLVFDNAEGVVRSAQLAAAMTSGSIQGRLLGTNQTKRAPWSACVFLTGNNLALAGDIATRFLAARIDARTESPEERDSFTIPDLRAYVREHRPELVAAAMTVLRYGAVLETRPALRRFGRFEDYDRFVRTPLVELGRPDPGDTRVELRNADPERERLRELLERLGAAFPCGAPFTSAEAVKRLAIEQDEAKRLPYRLRSAVDRVCCGLVLRTAGRSSANVASWLVESCA